MPKTYIWLHKYAGVCRFLTLTSILTTYSTKKKSTSLLLNSNDELIEQPEALLHPSLLGQFGVKLKKWPCSGNCVNKILESLYEVYITSTYDENNTKSVAPEPEGSSQHSQQPANEPYSEPGESTPHLPANPPKVNFHPILPFTPWSFK
jgi:hypothetical protein